MEDKLRAHMDYLFRDIPETKKAVEIKEEILQNITDKYHDLLADGKTEDEAYNAAVSSIGDLSDLLESLKEEAAPNTEADRELDAAYKKWKKRSALCTTIAVMLYILSVVPAIITDALHLPDAIGACGLFVFIAAATGILIYNSMTKPERPASGSGAAGNSAGQASSDPTNTKNNTARQAMTPVKAVLWITITVLYFVISFSTRAWYITWLIFLIGASLEGVIKAIFDLKNGGQA